MTTTYSDRVSGMLIVLAWNTEPSCNTSRHLKISTYTDINSSAPTFQIVLNWYIVLNCTNIHRVKNRTFDVWSQLWQMWSSLQNSFAIRFLSKCIVYNDRLTETSNSPKIRSYITWWDMKIQKCHKFPQHWPVAMLQLMNWNIFGKHEQIFKILSPSDLQWNLQCNLVTCNTLFMWPAVHCYTTWYRCAVSIDTVRAITSR